MLDYVSPRLAASEAGKDFLEQREKQQGGDAGALKEGEGAAITNKVEWKKRTPLSWAQHGEQQYPKAEMVTLCMVINLSEATTWCTPAQGSVEEADSSSYVQEMHELVETQSFAVGCEG